MGMGAVSGAAPLTQPKVLLVEDDGMIAIDLEDIVRDAGFDVLGPCATATEALALLAVSRPDAALLDVGLPNGSTLPLAEALAAAEVPFALVTGYDPTELCAAGLATVPAVQKPFAADAVKGMLATLLDGGRT